MRIRNLKNKEDIIKRSNYIVNNYEDYKSIWKKYFKNNNPIYIEIGMGKGKFIYENAINNKNINYIGIEKYDNIIARAILKFDEKLDNLCIIRCNALDVDKIFDKEIDRIYLNFSDPWPKKRHHDRRLTSNIFLDKYEKVLKRDGSIFIKTDNSELYRYSLSNLSKYNYFLDNISFDVNKDYKDNIKTEYEEKFIKNGNNIYGVCAYKMSNRSK